MPIDVSGLGLRLYAKVTSGNQSNGPRPKISLSSEDASLSLHDLSAGLRMAKYLFHYFPFAGEEVNDCHADGHTIFHLVEDDGLLGVGNV